MHDFIIRVKTSLLWLIIAAALSCGGGDTSTGPHPSRDGPGAPTGAATPASAILIQGDAQTDSIGSRLAVQLIVQIADAKGAPVSGVAVNWATSSGQIAGAGVSNGEGRAAATWTLGDTTGAARTVITAGALSPIVVNAKVLPGAPVTVRLPADSATLTSIGDSLSLSVEMADRAGNAAYGADVLALRSADTSIVGIGTTPVLIARGNGRAAVIVQLPSRAADTLAVLVAQRPARVSLLPGDAILLIGDTVRFVAAVADSRGVAITGVTPQWKSSLPSVVDTRTGNGVVIAQSVGSATLTATVDAQSASVNIQVRDRTVAAVHVTGDSAYLPSGTTRALTATLIDERGRPLSGRATTWTTSDSTRATVSDAGAVTARIAGAVVITATSEGSSGSLSLTVVPGTVAALTPAEGDQQSGTAGALLSHPLVARAIDAAGNPVPDVELSWSASGHGALVTSVQSTGADGTARATWRLDTLAGANTVTVSSVSGATGSFKASGYPGPVVRLTVSPPDLALEGIDRTAALTAEPVDQYGNLVASGVTWTATPEGIVKLTPTGGRTASVTSVARGTASVTATLGDKSATSAVTVNVGSSLYVASVAPDTLRPGTIMTLTGANFGPTASANTVTIAGVTARITSASATQLTAEVPTAAQLPCLASGPVALTLAVGTQVAHPNAVIAGVGARKSLAKGASIVVSDLTELQCIELPVNGGHYIASIYNTSQVIARVSTANFVVRGSGGLTSSSPLASLERSGMGQLTPMRAVATSGPSLTPRTRNDRATIDANRRLMGQLGDPRPAWTAAHASSGARFSRLASPIMPGSVRSFNISQGFATDDYCSDPAAIAARAVYVGDRIAVYEDVAAPMAGSVDSVIQRIGRDYDQRQFGILSTNFGNPLAMDSQLDGNELVLAVISDRVGQLGLDGFVTSADFYPTAVCQASNTAEVIYLAAPTSNSDAAFWRQRMGGVLIHEGKHETAIAEAVARDGYFGEATWLEESTAQVASELWGRAQGGYGQFANVGWEQALACESEDCPGKTIAALDPWSWLYGYYVGFESVSLLGDDYSGPYGGDWLLLRWTIDHSGVAEATFLRQLISSGEHGVANLEHRSGMAWSTIMGEFTLAAVVDDYPGVTFENPHLTNPSWNSRDVVLNFWNTDLTTLMQMRKLSYGSFELSFPAMTAGEAALLDLSGVQDRPQTISIVPAVGDAHYGNIRVSIVRVE